jgi:hypothetical protein
LSSLPAVFDALFVDVVTVTAKRPQRGAEEQGFVPLVSHAVMCDGSDDGPLVRAASLAQGLGCKLLCP